MKKLSGSGGIVLILAFVLGAYFFTTEPGVYRFKHLWILNTLFWAWFIFSVGYKIILILDLKRINLSPVGVVSFMFFGTLVMTTHLLVKTEVPAKSIGWYCDLIIIFSLTGNIFIDALVPFTDIDALCTSFKNFCSFFRNLLKSKG